MANLSNINNKFVVEQTTGYVGVGTTDPNFLIEVAGTNSEIALNSTSASIYRVRSTSNDEFMITKNGVGDRLVISSGGNATFSGDVLVEDNLYLTDAGTVRGKIQLNSSDRDNLDIKAVSLGSLMRFYTVDTLALTLDDSQNATFAKDVTARKLIVDGASHSNVSRLALTRTDFSWGIFNETNLRFYVQSGNTTTPNTKVLEIATNGSILQEGPTGGGTNTFFTWQYGNDSNYRLDLKQNVGSGIVKHIFDVVNHGISYSNMLVLDRGKIGIGTDAPSSKLEVKMNDAANNRLGFTGDGSTTGAAMWTNWQTGNSYLDFRLGGTTDTYTKMRIDSSGDVQFNGNTVISTNTADGSDNAQLIIAGGGTDGDSRGASVHISGNESGNGGLLQLRAGSGSISQIRFYTSATEMMRLTSNGRLGIGTTSPSSKLQIKDSQDSSFDSGIGIIRSVSSQTGYVNMVGGAFNFNAPGGVPIRFRDGGTVNVTIDGSGNVGIGTTSPSGKLTVDNASGNTITIRKGTGTPAIAFGGTNANEAVGLLEGIAGGGFKFYIGSGTLASPTWNQGFIIANDGDVYNYQSLNRANTFYGAYAGDWSSNTSGNTFMGYNVGNNLTTGNNNTGVGRDVFIATLTGGENTAVGRGAGRLIGTGSRNSLLGDGAGDKLANGSDNVAIGYHSLYALNSSQNVAIGVNSGLSFTGSRLVAIGTDAGKQLTSDVDNVFIGQDCAHHRVSGIDNTFVGAYANYNGNSTGAGNTGIGKSAGYELTSGEKNTYLGRQAGYYTTTNNENTYLGWNAGLYFNASENTAVGSGALLGNSGSSSGNNNTALGRYAGYVVSSGAANTIIGHQSGIAITTGNNNTLVGKSSGDAITQGENNTAIGYYTGDEITTGDRNLCLGIAAGSGSSPFQVTTQDNRVVIGDNNITNAYIRVSWTVTSDKRDKTDFGDVPHGLDFVSKLKPTSYHNITDRETKEINGKRKYGFLAQDILELEGDNPVIIDNEDENRLSYQESNLVPVLVKAIQELKAEIELLKNK